jgi:TatD DNase family protein
MIDFHCHLDLYPDPAAIAASAQDHRITTLSVTTTPSAFAGTFALARDRPVILTALGLHPELAHQRCQELALFDKLVPTTPFVGEIGLDGSARFAQTRAVQAEVFTHILHACAEVGGRILSIHSRNAAGPVLEALSANRHAGTPVLHWFTGTSRQAEAAVGRGCWFSIGTPMLTTTKGRDLIARLPRDRVLTETDGPFVTHEHRPVTPLDIPGAVQRLARLWDLDFAETEATISANAQTLLAMHV